MCRDCWTAAGEPSEWTPRTARFIELVDLLYLDHSTGGPLHAVLDDWNLLGEIDPRDCWNEDAFDAATWATCDEIAAIMNEWTYNQRAAALAYGSGWIMPGVRS